MSSRDELGLSESEQIEIREAAVDGFVEDNFGDVRLQELPSDIEAEVQRIIGEAVKEIATHYGISEREAALRMTEEAALMYSSSKGKEGK
ncbi:MAG TPA: hypothetical protein VFA15_07315 [Nitrososphaera sp.]|nr:hypothetical protein [Nitrososphaera sp.]